MPPERPPAERLRRSSTGIRLTALMPAPRRWPARPRSSAARARSRPAAWSTTPERTGSPSSLDNAAANPGTPVAGPVSTTPVTGAAAPWALWKSSVLRTSAAIRRDALEQDAARLARRSRHLRRSPRAAARGRRGPARPRACSSVRRRRSASSLPSASRPPAAVRVNMQVVPWATARFVSPPMERYSSGCSSASGRCRARTIAKAERSMPSGRSPAPRTAARTRSTMSRRAATSTTRWRLPASALHDAERLIVEHRAVQRHGHVLLGLELHGRRKLASDRRSAASR